LAAEAPRGIVSRTALERGRGDTASARRSDKLKHQEGYI
jgi:hypothetical protein